MYRIADSRRHKLRMSRRFAALALGTLGLAGPASALTIVSTYTQDFNAMAGNVLPTGWTIDTRNNGSNAGVVDVTATSLTSSSTGQAYKFTSGTDSAIGLLNSGSFSRNKTIKYAYTNSTAETIQQIDLQWNYEKYRQGNRAWDWVFTSSLGAGASAGNQSYASDGVNGIGIFPPQSIAEGPFSITGLSLAPGQTIHFTWTLTAGGDTNGQALAIDDFVLSALADTVILPPPPPPATQVIAEQHFDIIGAAYPSNPTGNSDAFPAGSANQELTNIGSKYDGASPTTNGGMTFRTLWTDTRTTEGTGPVDLGNDSGDFIGVNSFAGANNPDVNPAGTPYASFSQYNFEFNDADGRLDLIFDPVNTSGFSDVTLDLAYWITNTGYEAQDNVSITLADELGNIVALLNLGEAALEAAVATSESAAASWRQLIYSLTGSPLTGTQLRLTISVDNNSADENIFVDSIVFRGTPSVGSTPAAAPEPASFALTALASALAMAVRPSRRQS